MSTEINQNEKNALLGNRMAVIQVVSALRRYRAEVAKLLDARWNGGHIDGVTSLSFADTIEEIEKDLNSEEN